MKSRLDKLHRAFSKYPVKTLKDTKAVAKLTVATITGCSFTVSDGLVYLVHQRKCPWQRYYYGEDQTGRRLELSDILRESQKLAPYLMNMSRITPQAVDDLLTLLELLK